MNRPFLVTGCISLFLSSCTWQGSLKMHENVGWGGRIVAIDVDQNDPNNVWAASPTGGLFHTAVGGSSWAHYDALPESNCFDVKLFPGNSNVVIASCIEDTKMVNGGGIWTSYDGGNTWNHPTTAIPHDAKNNPLRNSAFGIAFQASAKAKGGFNILVGTDSGFASSPDQGVTWRLINPQISGEKNSIFSILGLANGRVITFGDDGIWMSDNGLTGWSQDNNHLPFKGQMFRSLLTVSPISNDHIFMTNDFAPNALFYSLNGGKDWNGIDADFTSIGGDSAGRGIYVKAVPSLTFNINQVDLYLGNAAIVCKKTITWDGSDYHFNTPWKALKLNHTDNMDLSFSSDGITMYAGNDGGVEKSVDAGSTWSKSGTAANGLDALQVYDTRIFLAKTNYSQNSICFGTQDNDLYASSDNGQTWPQFTVPEGGNFQGPVTPTDSYIMTYFIDQGNSRSGPVFNHPGGKYLKAPFPLSFLVYYVRDKSFMTIGQNGPALAVYLSSNDGKVSWKGAPIVNVIQPLYYHLKISGPSSNPSIIAAFSTGPGFGLVRIDNAFDGIPGNELITPIPLPPHCDLGLYGEQFISDIVSFGADPNDPNFLIVPDVVQNTIWITADGGVNWTPRDDLADLITHQGKYFFSQASDTRDLFESRNFQVSNIAFDPNNPDRIMIGTTEAGAFYSPNHGSRWYEIAGSEQIPNITSFAFNQVAGPEECIASSWGRGLWTLSLDYSQSVATPLRYPRGKKSHEIVQGDRKKANELYADTTYTSLTFQDGFSTHQGGIWAASGSKIYGKHWYARRDNGSIDLYLDRKKMNPEHILLHEDGSFVAEIPPISSVGPHQISVIQYDKKRNKKDLTVRFTVLPKDKETR